MIENIIPSKIETKQLYFQLADDLSADLLVQSFNYLPFIFISKFNTEKDYPDKVPLDGTTIDPTDIIYIKLHNSQFLPEIELYCDDSKGVLFNDFYPFDHDTLISIFVKSNSENTFPIRMDFRVTEHETMKVDDEKNVFKYLIKGILDVDDLYYTKYDLRKGTSFDVLKKLATDIKLGFSTNIQKSDDEMKWINPNNTYLNFIEDITKYAYVSDESFIWTFIDFNYNLNYIDINVELNEMIKNRETMSTNKQIVLEEKEENVLLYLTNNTAFKMTNHYINRFNLVNNSFRVNLEKSYKMKTTWYNNNENTVYKKFVNELKTDPDPDKLKVLLDEYSEIKCKNLNDDYFIGKLDTDNVHKNYFFTKMLNIYNLRALDKIKMIVTLNKLNFSITRFQTLRVEIYNPDDMFSTDANEKGPLDNLNTKLSGFWFVTGINYLYKRSGGVEQEIVLMRRDLNLEYGKGTGENDMRKEIPK